MNGQALGLIETMGLVCLINATDAMLKAAGAEAAGRSGELRAAHVIPRPGAAVLRAYLGASR